MPLKEEKAQPVELKMSPADMAELRVHVDTIAQGDVQLGRVLNLLVLHLSHAHGLDPAVEDAKAKALAEEAVKLEAKAEEEAAKAEGAANAS